MDSQTRPRRPFVRFSSLCRLAAASLAALALADPAGAQPAADAMAPAGTGSDAATPSRAPDVGFVPTPQPVVDAMLAAAKPGRNDVVYDLGSGDGRIAIAAAKRYGARAVGFDIDPQRIREATENARAQGVGGRVRFVQGDLFEQDLSGATIITLYLLPRLNLQLRPKLLELKPGTRIVSHGFDMGDWKPERRIKVDGSTVYLWRVPAAKTTKPAASSKAVDGIGTGVARGSAEPSTRSSM